MIAVDTNILIYAHRTEAPFNDAAHRCLTVLGEGRGTWAIPWPCIHEFLAVVTNAKVFRPATPLQDALDQVDAWRASPSLVLLAETGDYWTTLASIIQAGRVTGPRIHDARIAALCQLHGVRELWTADRDFTRFPGLAVFNPLVVDGAHESAPAYRARRRIRGASGRRGKRLATVHA